MDSNNKNNQIIQKSADPSLASKSPGTNYLIFAGITFIVFLVSGLGGYILGKRSSNFQRLDGKKVEPSPIAKPADKKYPNLPLDFEYKDNDVCSVKFALPPQKEPYYIQEEKNTTSSGNEFREVGFWKIDGSLYPKLLTKFPYAEKHYRFASAIYGVETAASDYIPAMVAVSCIGNGLYDDNQSMLKALRSRLDEYNNKPIPQFTQEPVNYEIEQVIETERWGWKVLDLLVSETWKDTPSSKPFVTQNRYTMFVTPKYIYEVEIFSMTRDQFVKETAQKIFDNLLFY